MPCPPGTRPLNVAFRTVHIVAMALVLGGLAQGAGRERLGPWIAATVLSGLALLALELRAGPSYLLSGAGLAVLAKLALLGLGNLLPGRRLAFYLAATALASVGAHMTKGWRHADLRDLLGLRGEAGGPSGRPS